MKTHTLLFSLLFLFIVNSTPSFSQQNWITEIADLSDQKNEALSVSNFQRAGELALQIAEIKANENQNFSGAGYSAHEATDLFLQAVERTEMADRKSKNYTQAVKASMAEYAYFQKHFLATKKSFYSKKSQEAIKRARTILEEMNSKGIPLHKDVEFDADALRPEMPEETPKEQDEIDVGPPQVIKFDMPDRVFALTVPGIFQLDKMAIEAKDRMRAALGSNPTVKRQLQLAHEYPIKNYAMQIEFVQIDRDWKNPCDRAQPADDKFRFKQEQINLEGGIKDACFLLTYRYDNRAAIDDDIQGQIFIFFEYKGIHYQLKTGIRNLDKEDQSKKLIVEKMEEMARSLRLLYDSPEQLAPEACESGKFMKLDKTVVIKLRTLDPDRNPLIIQQPLLEKDSQTPAAVENIAGTVLDYLKGWKRLNKGIKVTKPTLLEGDLAKSVQRAGAWKLRHFLQVEFLNEIMEGVGPLKGGPVSLSTLKYLEALRAAADGISGIGKDISNLSQKLYWEVPYIEYTIECTPRMKCVDKKWVPDLQFLELKSVTTEKGVEHSSNKNFMQTREIEQDLTRYYYPLVEEYEENAKKLEPRDQVCKDCIKHLWSFDWPKSDPCAALKDKINLCDLMLVELEDEKKVVSQELNEWKQSGKQEDLAQIDRNKDILQDQLDTYHDDLARKQTLLHNFETNKDQTGIDKTKAEILELQRAIDVLVRSKNDLDEERYAITSGEKEKEWTFKIEDLKRQIGEVNLQKMNLQSRLVTCPK